MTTLKRLPLLIVLLAAAACGGPPAGSVGGDPANAPLTLDQWKALPPPGKYDIDTLERLKAGEPKLAEPPAWQKFTRDVLLPAKKKDQSTPPRS